MKKILLILGSILSGFVFAQESEISQEDIWKKGKYRQDYISGIRSMDDGLHYTTQEFGRSKTEIHKYDYHFQKLQEVVLSSEDLDGIYFSSYEFNADETKILLTANRENIYRHSFKADFYIYDRATKQVEKVAEGKQMLATFSPDSKKIAFVKDRNLYIKHLESGKISQVTNDGKEEEIINGAPDWVYEEEFGFNKAFQWNADGTKIAYYRFDESKVPYFSMDMFNQQLYPSQDIFKYPKAGEKNSEVSIWIYDINSEDKFEAPVASENEFYIPRIKWSKNPKLLTVQRMNRHQNKLDFLLVNAHEGSAKVLFTETDKAYVEIHDDLTFLKNGKSFIWSSERDGYRHLYLYDIKGKEKKQITKGKWEVTKFYGINEKTRTLYFQSTKASHLQRKIYKTQLGTKKIIELTKQDGTHDASFSKSFEYFIDHYSNVNTPNIITLRDNKGNNLRTLKHSKRLRDQLKNLKVSKKEFVVFTNRSGVDLHGYMIKPRDFDPKKKYPVLMYLYGGPGSQMVLDKFDPRGNFMWYQMLADYGYIIACFDNQGTGGRGSDFKKRTYLQLGKLETEDQIDANKYLASLPYVDGGRIGIWGWSYGGYMSSNCLFQGNKEFKMAIAVAPVTNWRYYDSIYTERYMRTPQENAKGYDLNSPIHHAKKLKGKYLLIHGSADDNVHYQNAIEMMTKLISENKDFDSEIYPDKNHGIYGGNNGNTRVHLYNKMTKFILENL